MGCSASKTAAAEVMQPAVRRQVNGTTPADSTVLAVKESHKAEQTVGEEQPHHHVKVSIVGVSGLCGSGGEGARSDVVITAEIPGKPDTKSSTPIVSGIARKKTSTDHPTVEIEFSFQTELKGWVATDKILFTVLDHASGAVLGRAAVPQAMVQACYEGDLALTDGGAGYTPFLQVKMAREQIFVETVHEVTDALAAGFQILSAEAKQLLEVETKRMQEVKKALEVIKDDARATLETATEAKDVAVDAVEEGFHGVKESISEAVLEVEETKGHVCLWC
eukprot:CAMPEP_0183405728 /NCGR_PEP_ID=MMETSP0370-20130417/16042_1 /TAXON_ID=268820 /ORGANISM="Peridinium aciculiferum, Strain PAER-2" /LENGTH=277 /DNA_ID=CAMNT_0025587769 /DNA_START=54 /DNA_END=887 /DNA_ORIENTATION=-